MEPTHFHVRGAPPVELRLVEVIEELTRGSHRPLRCDMEYLDGRAAGEWVLKPCVSVHVGTQDEDLSVLKELAGAEVMTWFLIPTPAIGVCVVPDEIGGFTKSQPATVRESLEGNRGRTAFCLRYLPGAADWEREMHRVEVARTALHRYGAALLLADAFILHDDRTVDRPNVLFWDGHMVAIDHGSAFAGIYEQGAGVAAFTAADRLLRCWSRHVTWEPLRNARTAFNLDQVLASVEGATDAEIDGVGARWPRSVRSCRTRGNSLVCGEMLSLLKARRPLVRQILETMVAQIGR